MGIIPGIIPKLAYHTSPAEGKLAKGPAGKRASPGAGRTVAAPPGGRIVYFKPSNFYRVKVKKRCCEDTPCYGIISHILRAVPRASTTIEDDGGQNGQLNLSPRASIPSPD